MNQIPEKNADSSAMNKERKFLTSLLAVDYLVFEREALERGLKGFDLARLVLEQWLKDQGYHPSSSSSVAGDAEQE